MGGRYDCVQRNDVTYQKIFELKFREDVPTYELGRRFPKERKKISRVALLDLPIAMLRKLIKQEGELKKLLFLKRWFLGKEVSRKKR